MNLIDIKSKLSSFEYHSDHNIFYLFIQKIYNMIILPIYVYLYNFKYRKDLKSIKKLKNTKMGPALVMANGPRLKSAIENFKINSPEICDITSKFAINFYALGQELIQIEPNYYVLTDPTEFHNPINSTHKNNLNKLFTKLNERKITCFYPVNFNIKNLQIKYKNIQFIGFVNIYSPSSKNFSNATKIHGMPTLSAYYSIMLALHLGYSPIYIAGFDNDSFKTIRRVHNDFNLELNYIHFFGPSTNYLKLKDSLEHTLKQLSEIFRIHRSLIKRHNIIDLDNNSINPR